MWFSLASKRAFIIARQPVPTTPRAPPGSAGIVATVGLPSIFFPLGREGILRASPVGFENRLNGLRWHSVSRLMPIGDHRLIKGVRNRFKTLSRFIEIKKVFVIQCLNGQPANHPTVTQPTSRCSLLYI